MSSSHEKERRDLIKEAARFGWFPAGGSNYLKMHCSCGRHQVWLHKTPSAPNYWRNRLADMRRKCSGDPL